jgi:hypothetical protein
MVAREVRQPVSEELQAATRLVLGLSAAVGGMAGLIGWVGAQPTGLLLIPTAALVGALILRARTAASWCGAVLWLLVLPHAHGEAMLGPLLMLVACTAIALGPERFAAMVARDWQGAGRPTSDEPAGWFEER